MTPAGLEPAIPGSVGRCLIHWATGPVLLHAWLTHVCKSLTVFVYIHARTKSKAMNKKQHIMYADIHSAVESLNLSPIACVDIRQPNLLESEYGHTGIWTQGLPHAKRMWYHYTMCPVETCTDRSHLWNIVSHNIRANEKYDIYAHIDKSNILNVTKSKLRTANMCCIARPELISSQSIHSQLCESRREINPPRSMEDLGLGEDVNA